ncbi:glycosyltransferase family 2 protein [Thermoproteus tenax]|uniref:Glycosyl transferase fused to membrane domain n=1 Tax=Thermoproteus tenax (strain ATCC 35583 / DSM 2078 / JCM 9277 / NBRC 100435 / Kra 1) TaxID=768679 RepID=G4RP60_THETK|nr:glycosyl transferase fused to membrane domain [Thermoproteus tenax Kra 1]
MTSDSSTDLVTNASVLISLIVPTYNEAENLPALVDGLRRAFSSPFELIVVDDSSPDGTADVARRLAETAPVRVIVRERRAGLSSAVVEGARHARGQIAVVMDADLQHPPEIAPLLAQRVWAGFDLAVGTRFKKGGGIEGWPLYRLAISKGAAALARLLIPEARGLSDPESGFFAVRTDCLRRVRPTGLYKILLDVLVQCRPEKIAEVPYVFRPRARGRSKLGLRHMADYVLQLMRLSGWRPLKFAAVGASGVGVAEGVLYALGGVPFHLSAAAALEASITSNYVLNRAWTFRGRGGSPLRGWAKYHAAVAAGGLANYLVANALYLAGVSKYLAYALGVLAGFVANYVLAERWAFKSSRDPR